MPTKNTLLALSCILISTIYAHTPIDGDTNNKNKDKEIAQFLVGKTPFTEEKDMNSIYSDFKVELEYQYCPPREFRKEWQQMVDNLNAKGVKDAEFLADLAIRRGLSNQ